MFLFPAWYLLYKLRKKKHRKEKAIEKKLSSPTSSKGRPPSRALTNPDIVVPTPSPAKDQKRLLLWPVWRRKTKTQSRLDHELQIKKQSPLDHKLQTKKQSPLDHELQTKKLSQLNHKLLQLAGSFDQWIYWRHVKKKLSPLPPQVRRYWIVPSGNPASHRHPMSPTDLRRLIDVLHGEVLKLLAKPPDSMDPKQLGRIMSSLQQDLEDYWDAFRAIAGSEQPEPNESPPRSKGFPTPAAGAEETQAGRATPNSPHTSSSSSGHNFMTLAQVNSEFLELVGSYDQWKVWRKKEGTSSIPSEVRRQWIPHSKGQAYKTIKTPSSRNPKHQGDRDVVSDLERSIQNLHTYFLNRLEKPMDQDRNRIAAARIQRFLNKAWNDFWRISDSEGTDGPPPPPYRSPPSYKRTPKSPHTNGAQKDSRPPPPPPYESPKALLKQGRKQERAGLEKPMMAPRLQTFFKHDFSQGTSTLISSEEINRFKENGGLVSARYEEHAKAKKLR